MTDKLIRGGMIVTSLAETVQRGSIALKNLPGMLYPLLRDGMWREFRLMPSGEVVSYDSFEEFVKTNVPHGLESDIHTLKALCNGDEDLLSKIDEVTPTKLWTVTQTTTFGVEARTEEEAVLTAQESRHPDEEEWVAVKRAERSTSD